MAQDRRTTFRLLEERRKLAGLQWSTVCKSAGVSYSTVWRALGEGNVPREDTLGKLDAALGDLIQQRVANLKRLGNG